MLRIPQRRLLKKLALECSTTELLRNVCPATTYSHRGKPPITIGAEELNFRVRDGNGCDLFAIVTGQIKYWAFDAAFVRRTFFTGAFAP